MHCASNEAWPLHDHCSEGSTSWCKYKRDRANCTNLYKHGPSLPLDVTAKLKPEFNRLSEDRLRRLTGNDAEPKRVFEWDGVAESF